MSDKNEIDAKLAEITADFPVYSDGWDDGQQALLAERDELRAEVERLKAACIGDCENRLIEALDEQLGLREEIERLRAALEKIAGLAARPDFHVGGVQSLIWNEAMLALGRSKE